MDLKSKNEKIKDFNRLMHMHPPPPSWALIGKGCYCNLKGTCHEIILFFLCRSIIVTFGNVLAIIISNKFQYFSQVSSTLSDVTPSPCRHCKRLGGFETRIRKILHSRVERLFLSLKRQSIDFTS